MCGYFAMYIEHASIICFWFYAKSPSTKQKTISVSQGWSVERVSFFQLAVIFLFLLTIHTNPRVEILWWENAPLQSISKWTKQSKKSRKVAKPKNRPHKFWSLPLTPQIPSGISAFPMSMVRYPWTCSTVNLYDHIHVPFSWPFLC